ncbi:MAG: sugar phosphate isomerase/epimerase family protein [Salinibacter sp.]
MSDRALDIGVVTDEVSRDLAEALDVSREWGISRFELREGGDDRFPFFTDREVHLVDEAVRSEAQITAVSPGILKGTVDDQERLHRELEAVLPRAIERARRFECPRLVVFGLARHEEEPSSNRTRVMRTFERVAERAAAAGLTVAIENEPDFWIGRPGPAAALLDEIDHPALTLNWDPANQHWGGLRPDRRGFETIRPHISNVHVKDYTPDDPDVPWRPVGEGVTPWGKILSWIVEDTTLGHVTLETHCKPLVENSRASLDVLETLIAEATATHPADEPNA